MFFAVVCLLIFGAAYLVICLAAHKYDVQHFWKLLLIGALTGVILVTPLLIYAPQWALAAQDFVVEMFGEVGQKPSLAGSSVGGIKDAPWAGLRKVTGVHEQYWLLAILAAGAALSGIYLGTYRWFRIRRDTKASLLYSLCSFAVIVLPWLLAAGLLLSPVTVETGVRPLHSETPAPRAP